MDAGVPVKDAVAGIAMGLIKEGDDIAILSDILGDEDHLGDMDFKVTGTSDDLSPYAPRITTVHVKPDQVRTVIGAGGKTVRGIIEATGCGIDIEDDGRINISSSDGAAAAEAARSRGW